MFAEVRQATGPQHTLSKTEADQMKLIYARSVLGRKDKYSDLVIILRSKRLTSNLLEDAKVRLLGAAFSGL